MNKKDLNWDNPPYDEKDLLELCKKSQPSDFIAAIGRDLYGKTYIAITSKRTFNKWNDISYYTLEVAHLFPIKDAIRFVGAPTGYNHEANIWLTEEPLADVINAFGKAGFEKNEEFSKLIELKFFKKPIPRNTMMEMEEFFELMKNTTENLKKMRAAQEYMRWQFGEPFCYEEFLSEIKDTMEGWVSSHC